MQRFGAVSILYYSMIYAHCSVVSNAVIQTPTPTTRVTIINSNKSKDLPQSCVHRHFKFKTSRNGHMSMYTEGAYCNVSVLNEDTGFGLQHETQSLKVYCLSALSSILWDRMFYQDEVESLVSPHEELVTKSIQIENCHLTTISHEAFKGLGLLRTLTINGGYLDFHDSLCDHTKLTDTLGETNTVEAICYLQFPSGIFSPLKNLKQLTLNALKLNDSIWEQIRGLTRLQGLSMQRNSITVIDKGTLSKLKHLKKLDLSNNYIQAISSVSDLRVLPSDSSIPKGNVTLLDISHNNIPTIEYDAQSSLLSLTLEKLIIHDNNMTSTAWLTNSTFPALEALDISQNRVSGRMSNVAWPKTLAEFNASRNDIEHLTIVIPHGYGKETSLKLLDASHNQITDIEIVQESKSTKGVQISLFLGHNPFHCDCNLVWLQELISSQNNRIKHSYVLMDSDALYCQTLARHEPSPMKDIKPENFLCEYNELCPETCTCYKNELSSRVNIVDCKGNHVTTISTEISADCTTLDLSGNVVDTVETGIFDRLTHLEELFMNSSQISKIEAGAFRNQGDLVKLDIANNKLQAVEAEMFKGLERLEILDLSLNKLNHIREGSLAPLKALKQLNLRNNQLKMISESEFQFFSQLESVKLSQNPWSCECGYVDLMKGFLNQNTKRIRDLEEITCEQYDKEKGAMFQHVFLEVNKSKFCINDDNVDNSLFIILVSVLSVIVIGLLALLLAFKYRKFLRIWCFVKFGWKCNRGNENDRHYDAFVSYSGLDCDFVAQELVPRLEEPGHGKVGYKLCVHDRDFPAGESTAETIIDMIENSKRVIVVLSNNYLRSRWCKYEFEQAHYQLVQEGRNRIIMIVLEELDTDLIYTEMGNYMMTRTYLKHSDPMLWAKIQHAMPVAGTHKCVGNLNQDNDSDIVEFIEMGYM